MKSNMISLAILLAVVGAFHILQEHTLPSDFGWDNINSTNFLSPIRNQYSPQPCNSGWALSATAVLNSRIKIKRNAKWPDITISPQVLLDCDTLDYGCFGGDPWTAYKWISLNDITDETCNSYVGKSTGRCTSSSKCMQCQSDGCVGMYNSKVYGVESIGVVEGEQAMMEEIYNRGPISCGVGVTPLFRNYTKGVFADSTDSRRIQHYVVVYGWGVEGDNKYWKVQNSWGTFWGESGTFRIARGKNNMSIETECSFAIPKDTWTQDIRNKTPPTAKPNLKTNYYSYLPSASFDWRTPVNYLTSDRGDNTPSFCSSSWALAVTTTISDKLKIKTKGQSSIHISPQVLLNCGIGTCSKGNPQDAIIFARKFGLPDQSCQNYIGTVPSKASCTDIQNCASCSGTLMNFTCAAAKNSKRWIVPDSGKITGATDMKTEIQKYGPIVCGMHFSTTFGKYTGGVFSETTIYPTLNHYVEVVGYGSENGKEYWSCRNFMGTAWGESGFFRIEMHGNNLGIEKECYWIGQPN